MKQERKSLRVRQAIACAAAIIFCLSGAIVRMAAETMPDGYAAVEEALPEEIRDRLPEAEDATDAAQVGEVIGEMMRAEYLLTYVREFFGLEMGNGLRLLAKVVGLLILSAVFAAFRDAFSSQALAKAVRFCTTAAIFAAVLSFLAEHFRQVQRFLEHLSTLMEAMIPVAGSLWAMGGNVSTAAAGTAGMYSFLAVCQHLCAKITVPLCCFCTALALCSALAPDTGLRGLAGAVKKIYTFLLGLMMSLLLASLGSQTVLSAAADSTTARAAKFVSASAIPIVGGSVGETLRTVAASVQYLKSVVGIGGVLFILLLLIPVLLTLVMTRLAFLLGGGVAELLGCDAEGRLLSELGHVYGCMIAVVAMTSVMFIFALVIFIKTTVAVG